MPELTLDETSKSNPLKIGKQLMASIPPLSSLTCSGVHQRGAVWNRSSKRRPLPSAESDSHSEGQRLGEVTTPHVWQPFVHFHRWKF